MLVIVAVLSVLGAVATLAQPLLVGQVIERVQVGETLGPLVWLLIALVVVSSVISGYQHYLLQRTGTAVVYSSRRKLIARILHLPISEFDARRTGDLVSRVGTDTTLLYAVLTQGLADAVGNALIFVGALVAMALIDPILLALIIVVIGVSVADRGAPQRPDPHRLDRAAGQGRRARIGRRARGRVDPHGARRRRDRARGLVGLGARDRCVRASASASRRSPRSSYPIAGIALQVSLLVVLGVGGFRVASGAITIASLVTFIMFLFMMIAPLGSTFGAITSVNQALGALGRIQEVLDLPTEEQGDAQIAATLQPAAQPADEPGGSGAESAAIAFRDVRFRYPENVVAAREAAAKEARAVLEQAHLERAADEVEALPTVDRDVLRGVTFDVPRGARVALVGPSGAGKSTVLSLIERFYDPTGGAIELDGRDIRSLAREELRAQFGYVEQDAPTLAGTLADNLRLGSPEATDADCERVLHAVNLTEVLERDPLGLQAPVGEDGVMLSGGERQRLAIARALLAAPPILLLDESTSSLDGVNEQRMREAIDAVATGRTLIVIAHRLSTVVDSDLIVVLDHGQVVGQGTHSELVASTPLYRDLAKHQLLV